MQQIAKRFSRNPSTVSYWMAKFGLVAPNREKFAARGGLPREELAALVEADLSIAAIAALVGRSPTTVRHWLRKHGLETASSARLRAGRTAREAGRARVEMTCKRHGETDFWIEGRGAYRCLRCRQESVNPPQTSEGDPRRRSWLAMRDMRVSTVSGRPALSSSRPLDQELRFERARGCAFSGERAF